MKCDICGAPYKIHYPESREIEKQCTCRESTIDEILAWGDLFEKLGKDPEPVAREKRITEE
jgi:hypothetical protein